MDTKQISYREIFDSRPAFQVSVEEKSKELFAQGHLFLFDPMTNTNQCHLTAYRAATSDTSRQEDLEYMTAAFIITSVFNRERGLISQISGVDRRVFNQCLNSRIAEVKSVVASGVNRFIEESIRRLGTEGGGLDEVRSVSCEQQVDFPKFAGVVLLMKHLQNDPLPVVVKVKVVCEQGFHIIALLARTVNEPLKEIDGIELDRDCPVLVIEAIANRFENVEKVLAERRGCAQSLFRSSSNKRGEHRCRLCSVCSDSSCGNVKSVTEKLERLSIPQLLKAAGAAFTVENQEKGSEILRNSSLNRDFEENIAFAREQGISVSGLPSICMVEHMYADIEKSACRPKRLLDLPPQQVLRDRGVL